MKSGSSFLYLQYPLKMNRTDLKDASGISFNVLAKMGKNEFVSMESLMKICATLNCNVGDIVDFLPESEVEFHTHWDGVYRTLGPPFLKHWDSPLRRLLEDAISVYISVA